MLHLHRSFLYQFLKYIIFLISIICLPFTHFLSISSLFLFIPHPFHTQQSKGTSRPRYLIQFQFNSFLEKEKEISSLQYIHIAQGREPFVNRLFFLNPFFFFIFQTRVQSSSRTDANNQHWDPRRFTLGSRSRRTGVHLQQTENRHQDRGVLTFNIKHNKGLNGILTCSLFFVPFQPNNEQHYNDKMTKLTIYL